VPAGCTNLWTPVELRNQQQEYGSVESGSVPIWGMSARMHSRFAAALLGLFKQIFPYLPHSQGALTYEGPYVEQAIERSIAHSVLSLTKGDLR
jgi:hypothetical protein